MQTNLDPDFLATPQGREADSILRSCVHCGFCTATCPTYQLLADELDGPRGRIYLIKQVLEGHAPSAKTRSHLDRCLTCRSCETTCPSGVRYARLLDLGRETLERRVARSPWERFQRTALRTLLPHPRRLAPLLWLGRLFRPGLPGALRKKIPPRQKQTAWPQSKQPRTMLVLQGCAQSVMTPATNAAAARVLAKLGVRLVAAPDAGCCGALSQHLAAPHEAVAFMRRNIDAWWPYLEQGAEAIVISASGCGTQIKEYGHLLRHDARYAGKARRVSELAKDLSEVLRDENLGVLGFEPKQRKIAFHSPCTLQHGQQLGGVVESILQRAGFSLTPVMDSHLCCGSAGTYSILQAGLSQQLLINKVGALEQGEPELIVTANIGCQLHLATQAERPVKHWIELLDEALGLTIKRRGGRTPRLAPAEERVTQTFPRLDISFSRRNPPPFGATAILSNTRQVICRHSRF